MPTEETRIGKAKKTRRVALVGSSGGGAATLGHGDPEALCSQLCRQLNGVGDGATITAAVFVSCSEPLDTASLHARAGLWEWCCEKGTQGLRCVFHGSLEHVNNRARELDKDLACRVASEGFDGIISISADASAGGCNRQLLAAAAEHGIPVTGTGGTSLSIAASELGCSLVGNAGGSVATTLYSKAIGVAAAFARAWGEPYRMCLVEAASWHSSLDGCLPAFLAVACSATAITKIRHVSGLAPYLLGAEAALRERMLPPVVGAVVAHQASGLGEIGIIGGAAVGAMSQGSSCCAFLAARCFGWLAPRVLGACARLAVPATASTLSVAGGLAVAVGMGAFAGAPRVQLVTNGVRLILDTLFGGHAEKSLQLWLPPAWLRGALGGILMNYGSRYGWYHQIFLPLILVEMERGSMSLLGTFDWLTLCVAGAGACAAQLAVSQESADVALAKRGLAINLGFGDYIEACFPFLERDRFLNAAVYVASASSGAIATCAGARSTAYVAAPLAVVLSDSPKALTIAGTVAFTVPFVVGVLSNMMLTPGR